MISRTPNSFAVLTLPHIGFKPRDHAYLDVCIPSPPPVSGEKKIHTWQTQVKENLYHPEAQCRSFLKLHQKLLGTDHGCAL